VSHRRFLSRTGRAHFSRAAYGGWLAALIAVLLSVTAYAQDIEHRAVAQFYAGRVVTLYIGFSPGGGYDLYGRLVARHLGRHIPGMPAVVPMNMEGAGSLKLMNWLYAAAPADGTVLATVNRGVPFFPLVGDRRFAPFDPRRFVWLGSANDEVSVCVAWKRTGIATFEQLRQEELIVGSTGPGSDEFVFPRLLAGVLGARIRSVSGYAGGNDINFAMERGEVDGRCGWTWSSIVSTRQQWLNEGSINVLLQLALRKHPDLPEVPIIVDFAANEEERRILRLIMIRNAFGRPFLAPPAVPASRAAALRRAFETMVKDPQFLADATRSRAEIMPVSATELQELLAEAYATPPHIVERARQLLN
jgi:tripartite-type tricarboxylate transporter receptor subunit TctC